MEKLPLEVMCQILSYLNYRQRLNAGLVCKRWLHASGLLIEDVVLNVVGGDLPYATGRHFASIRFFDTIINDSCVHFLNRRRPLHLQFTKCEVQKTFSTNADCSELLTLESDSSSVLSLFQCLPSLETLILTYAHDVTAETLENGAFIGPSLKPFSMPCFLPDNNRSSQNKNFGGQEFFFDPKLILLSIEKFVRMRAKTLKFVQFPKYISTQVLLSISQVENLKLESVIFPDCEDCCTAIVDFCQNQPSIIALKLNYASQLSDADLCRILDHLPALIEFSIESSSTLDRFIVSLFARPNMHLISLDHCSLNTNDSFSAAIETLACFDLRVLKIFCIFLHKSHIIKLLSLLPRLNNLDLSHFSLSDEEFLAATLHLTRLQTLVLHRCAELRGRTLGHLTSLVHLYLRKCKGMTREGLLESVRFLNLKTLHLYDCFPSKVDDLLFLQL